MQVFDILDQVEAISSKKDKVSLLADHNQDKQLQQLLNLALDFKAKFYIKQFQVNPECKLEDEVDLHSDFSFLCLKLVNGTRGHEAILHVEEFLNKCTEQQARWYSRILRKDLRAGFSISTANKAGFDIPIFDVMLAKDGKQCKKLDEIVSKGVYCSPKLDGYRCIAVCSFGTVELYSRNGSVYQNFPAITDTLSEWCKDSQFVLDGEIMSDDFNAMQQTAFSSESKKSVGDVKYHVFGWVSMDEWKSEKFKQLTAARLIQLKFEFSKHNSSNIVMVNHTVVNSVDRVLEVERLFLAQGYEGAMILPDIPYFKGKKSNKLMKFKTMLSQDCKVVDMYEGTGKYKGSLGGLNLIQEDKKTTCDVGSGFTDADRQHMWNYPKSIIGRIAEIKYQELTDDGVMRFPIFLRWRNDKD